LHVSYYVNNQSHGGIYFGERGAEGTILRSKGWSDFTPKAPAPLGASNDANAAIMAYLGDPVPPPAGLDARYAPEGLKNAFTTLAKKANAEVKLLKVDDSEFPFLVYGVLAGQHEYRVLEDGLREMKDYAYAGSVVGGTSRGSTYFAINIIPESQCRGSRAATCNRRLMVRLQMLADAARQSEQ